MCLRKCFVSSKRKNKFQELLYACGRSIGMFYLMAVSALTFALATCDILKILPYSCLRENPKLLCSIALLSGCAAMFLYGRILRRTFKYEQAKHLKDPNHAAQLMTIIPCGVLIVGMALILGLNDNTNKVLIGVAGSLLMWVFQDIIKGFVTYFNLHSSDMLHVGDLVSLPKYKIYGRIKDFNLLNVTVENMDNTRSSVPISSLQDDSFVNMQRLVDHKTSGRLMKRSLIVDANSIKPMDGADVALLQQRMELAGADTTTIRHLLSDSLPSRADYSDNDEYLFADGSGKQLKVVSNLQLFRNYLRYWLAQHHDVTSEPRLMVRLMEPTAFGIPLQINAFIVEPSPEPFEAAQSRIMEHAILAMTWFGLRHYQNESDYKITKGGNNE